MKVLIDCDILKNRRTGVENYTYNLINSLSKELSQVKHSSSKTKLILLHNKDIKDPIFKKHDKMILDRLRFPLSRTFYSIFSPPKIKANIIHLPTPTAPFWTKPKHSKLVVTVHDLTPLKFPQYHPLRRRIYYKFILNHLLSQADRIIADSESTKKDIIKYFRIPRNKIKVIYLASDMQHTTKSVPSKYSIGSSTTPGYILYVGTVEPRKNLLRVIKAYKKLKPKEKLVIAGTSGWNNKEIYNEKNKEGNKEGDNNIIFTGYVANEDLNNIFSNAKIFIYPSIYEGFGFPILEAMKCRVPVITSKTSSMPEVAGDAALLVNPYSIDEIANAMKKLLNSKKLRNKLVKKGISQSKKFSWEKYASQTLEVYKEVYNEAE